MLYIVLVEPKNPGNIGAVARVMKNFEFSNLILVNPKGDHLCKEALDRATHAKNILKKAKIMDFKDIRFDYKIATTAKLGTDYNILRSPSSPEELAKKIKNIAHKKRKIALIFGREDTGLTNKELTTCDFSVTIETSKKYPTMNLSHAVSIVLYALYKQIGKNKVSSHIIPSSLKEKEQVMKILEEKLRSMPFLNDDKRDTQRKIWKKILGKSFLTKREAYSLIGFLKKIK